MPYVKQLLKVYSKEAGQVYETQEDLKNNQKLQTFVLLIKTQL